MEPLAATGALASCSMGAAPSPVNFLPLPPVLTPTPAGHMLQMIPMLNVMPFGVCISLANPMVASATAAALGVLTPMPCIPVPVGPWTSPAAAMFLLPAVKASSTLNCAWAGQISLSFPGQTNLLGG